MENSQIIISKIDLPHLPFKKDALEPYISEQTMEVHYNKHHRGYVEKLNKAIEENELEDLSLEEILNNVSAHGDALRNNAGGHYNHLLFWQILTPDKMQPYGKLLNSIEAAYESFDAFKAQFKKEATSLFGSGWTWLVLNKKGLLEIGSTPNQDNPLMDDTALTGYPLLGLDLWEHAFYLDYQNRKVDYIDAFWNIIDWTEVAKRYEDALLYYRSYDRSQKK